MTTIRDLASALVWMDDGDQITVTCRVGDLRYGMEMAEGGPEVMSTAQAARVFGWSSKRWRGWAMGGRVEGAWQEEDNRWRLPRDGCRKWVAELRARGSYPSKQVEHSKEQQSLGVTSRRSKDQTTSHNQERSVRRGPRKATARR